MQRRLPENLSTPNIDHALCVGLMDNSLNMKLIYLLQQIGGIN